MRLEKELFTLNMFPKKKQNKLTDCNRTQTHNHLVRKQTVWPNG